MTLSTGRRKAAFSATPADARRGSTKPPVAGESGSAIKRLLEGGGTKPPIGGEKALLRPLTLLKIGIDDGLDRIDDVAGTEATPHNVAD